MTQMWRSLVSVVCLVLLAATCLGAAEPVDEVDDVEEVELEALTTAVTTHPNMYLNATELAAIKAKVRAGASPWKPAYDKLLVSAASALRQAPLSVTYTGHAGHDYRTEPPYCGWTPATSPCGSSCCDGKINPNADRGDYTAAIKVGAAVRTLGLAYALTGNATYAAQALALIRTWALDPQTYMRPAVTNTQSEIELAITLPGLFYGADLLWHYSGWAGSEKAAFQSWARSLAASFKARGTSTAANNFGDWRLVLLATAAVVTEDAGLMSYVVSHYKLLVPNQIDASGRLVREINRATALSYATYAVNAISQVCEIARHWGVDLYHFKTATGRGSVERAFDWLAPYVENPAAWPYRQTSPYRGDNAAAFEFAYFTWRKSNYWDVIQQWHRPMTEGRTAGPVTLTHGAGAYSWRVW